MQTRDLRFLVLKTQISQVFSSLNSLHLKSFNTFFSDHDFWAFPERFQRLAKSRSERNNVFTSLSLLVLQFQIFISLLRSQYASHQPLDCLCHTSLPLRIPILKHSFVHRELIEQHAAAMAKRSIRIDPKCLHWTPKDWSVRAKW